MSGNQTDVVAEARKFLARRLADVGADTKLAGAAITDMTTMLAKAGLEKETARSTARKVAGDQGRYGPGVEACIDRGLAGIHNGAKSAEASPTARKDPKPRRQPRPGPTEHDIKDQFARELELADIIAHHLVADGKLRRCDAKGKGGKGDAAYLLFIGTTRAGRSYGVGGYQNWRSSNDWTSWESDTGDLDKTERDAIAEKRREAAAAHEADKHNRQAEARARAERELAGDSPLADDHPYLQRKGVRAHGLTADRKAIMVPMRDVDGVLHNRQKIGPDGTKRFLYGGRVDGCFHMLGTIGGERLCVAEGFATAATIHEATALPVAIAFDSGNLPKVARALRDRYLNARIVIAGDDDWKTTKQDGTPHNPGRIKATEAADAVGGVLVMPEFGKNREENQTDFNDMAAELGNEAVSALFNRALQPSPPQQEETGQGGPLEQMLSKFSIVLVGGSARILTWKKRQLYEGGDHDVATLLTAADFKLYHQNKFEIVKGPNGKPCRQQIANLFLDQAKRYDDLAFMPGAGPIVGKAMNLWRGFGVVPKAGRWPLLRAHMRDVMAAGIEKNDLYNFQWMAWTYQNPGRQAEVALVFRGLKGTGKGTLGNAMCRTFGPHGLQISNGKHLVGSFNMHMSQCTFLFADEAYWPGAKEGEGALKRLITEPTLTIETKGVDLFAVANRLHVMIAGNDPWLVPASGDERRFAVNDVSDHRRGDQAYFRALYAEMNNGGLAAMLHDMLAFDLKRWHPRYDVPQSDALQKQKAMSRKGVDALVEIIATEGSVPCSHLLYRDIAVTTGEGAGKGFYAHAKNLVPELRFVSSTIIATTLVEQWGCERWKSGNDRGVRFPPLAKLRAAFDARHGPQSWEAPEVWEDSNTT
jgi:phage/plasmid primase-like uncharacterized protein